MTVLGSVNMDISVAVPRLPETGATVLGGDARFTPGGKGANQAVAAARLGADVRMIGCAGADSFGDQLRGALSAEGIDITAVATIPDAPTGLALITIDANGENTIAVAPGANHRVGDREVSHLAGPPDAEDVLVISAEIPLSAIRSALARTAAAKITRMLNLAPVPQPGQAWELLAAGPDWLIVNESEAAALLGRPVNGLAEASKAAAVLAGILRAASGHYVVVTAGSAGAALAAAPPGTTQPAAGEPAAGEPAAAQPAAAQITQVPGFHVNAVDSVGAGDTFTGALAVAIAAGVPPAEAVTAAAAAAATKVTRHGAQAGMPRPADIEAEISGIQWPFTSSVLQSTVAGPDQSHLGWRNDG